MPKLGDVAAIPLPDGGFAYARVYDDASIGIYDLVTNRIADVDEVICRPFAFIVACSGQDIENGRWPIIGQHPFESEDEASPPPTYVEDILNPGTFDIYYKGETRPATPEEVVGLEEMCVYPPQFVIDRILRELGGERDSDG